jgi:hypothetical protein
LDVGSGLGEEVGSGVGEGVLVGSGSGLGETEGLGEGKGSGSTMEPITIVTWFELEEYICKVSLSERIENVHSVPDGWRLSNTAWPMVIVVFKAWESPTLPVAIPYPFPFGAVKEIAYLSGWVLHPLGADQFKVTVLPSVLPVNPVGGQIDKGSGVTGE